jgi:thiol:disulfide interchange protein DsbD
MKRIIWLLFGIVCNVDGYTLKESLKELSPTSQQVSLIFTLQPQEYLYKESLIPSTSAPEVSITPLKTTSKTVSFFDETYKKQKEGYTGTVTFTTVATLQKDAPLSEALMHLHFMVSSTTKPQEKMVPLRFSYTRPTQNSVDNSGAIATQKKAPTPLECEPTTPSIIGTVVKKILNFLSATIAQAQATMSSLFTQTGSGLLRLLAALLLGILLSLTPCIYPMIPITIGVLQASGSSSKLSNFLLALCYTLGISLTFALLGFIAALGSSVFGELQGSPFILIPLIVLLFYFGLVMFDIVQMPIPSWLQAGSSKVKGGSKRAAFMFGMISGTVASPCLSPGLILILNYVAHVTSVSLAGYVEGFLLLFIFGIGSSLPLLIIGTFSGSLAMLPKAGAWMIEVKKLVGIMLISMALYHLSHLERIIPWYLFVWVASGTFIALGIYYFATLKPYDSIGIKRYKNLIGTLLIVVACIIAVQGHKSLLEQRFSSESPKKILAPWLHAYEQARTQALADKKLLFIDVGATYCAACKALDARIFTQASMQPVLSLMTLLKIDADVHTEEYELIKKRYGSDIIGYPTYLLVDPQNEKVLKKWSVELDELSLQGVADMFQKAVKEHAPSY